MYHIQAGLATNSQLPRKKKRNPPKPRIVPEEAKVFSGLSFLFLPNDRISPVQDLRVQLALDYGGKCLWFDDWRTTECERPEWKDDVDYIIVENDRTYASVLGLLSTKWGGPPIPSSAHVVNDNWRADSQTKGRLQVPFKREYRLLGQYQEDEDAYQWEQKYVRPFEERISRLLPDPDNASTDIKHSLFHITENIVAIADPYPQSTGHAIVFPRSQRHLHPLEAFKDLDFLKLIRAELEPVKQRVKEELRKRFSRYSAQERPREDYLLDLPDDVEIPDGRDWMKEVVVGIHRHPAIKHLHIHILSVDRDSTRMHYSTHYRRFTESPYFIPLADLPLADDDERMQFTRYKYLDFELNSDLRCWRCGQTFGADFAMLKQHVDQEFMEWRAE